MCVIHWFLHKFNVGLVDTLRAFKAAARLIVMCPATAPLLNPTPASVQWPQQLRAFSFNNEDIIMDGLGHELAAYLACEEGFSFTKLTALQIWLHARPRKSSQVETE